MKTKQVLLITSLLVTGILPITTKAQTVSSTDSLALVDFYNSTNGASWSHHQNWLTTKPVGTWYGLTVSSGRVTSLVLHANHVTGKLPVTIGNLTALTTLVISNNRINNTLPPSIGSLSALTIFDANTNNFSGTIPVSIGRLSQLTYLELSQNHFSGVLTDSITRLTNLAVLKVIGNGLSGKIPADIGNLAQLTDLELNNNQITGSLPASITSLHKLVTLNANYNQLSGRLPSDIGNLDSLQALFLAANQLSGNIPFSIGDLSQLKSMELASNALTGNLPTSLGKLKNLTILSLATNQISGPIPPNLGNMSRMETVLLGSNQLSGSIPSSFSNLTHLFSFDVSANALTGSLPPELVKIPGLVYITVNNNALTDGADLNSVTLKFPNLHVDISGNRFTFNTMQYAAKHFRTANYSPQAALSIHQHGSQLAVSAGGTLSNNTYTWYLAGAAGGTTITGDSTFTPSQSGAYYATVTNSIATAVTLTTDTVSYTVSPVVKDETPMKLSVYPNPAGSRITIGGISGKSLSHIIIADINGHIWISTTAAPQATVTTNVSQLKPGNYTLRITNGKQTASIGFMKE